MRDELLIVGLGGQGIVLAGQLLAQAAMDAGMEVTWFPSYSPEVRGGEATCSLVIADGRVSSPICRDYGAVILLSPTSVPLHVGRCAPGGVAIINTSLGTASAGRDDIQVIEVPANDLAAGAGSDKAANMVAVGVYLGARAPGLLDATLSALPKVLPARHHKLIPINEAAIRAGMAVV